MASKAPKKSRRNVDKSKSKSNRSPTLGQLAHHPEMRGRGPKKGAPNAGRPPDAWKEACRAALTRAEYLKVAEEVIKNKDHPAWLGAAKFLAEQGYGKPSQPVEVSGDLKVTFE